jgi:hypothetical protein
MFAADDQRSRKGRSRLVHTAAIAGCRRSRQATAAAIATERRGFRVLMPDDLAAIYWDPHSSARRRFREGAQDDVEAGLELVGVVEARSDEVALNAGEMRVRIGHDGQHLLGHRRHLLG